MFISRPHKILFLAVPKTSTRSIYNVLGKRFGGKIFKDHNKVVPRQLVPFTSFIVSRNPYDRFISFWWSVCKRGNDKRAFIKLSGSTEVLPFARMINTPDHKLVIDAGKILLSRQVAYHKPNRVDHVIRFEHLEQDFNALPFVKTKVSLPTLNPTLNKREPWIHYYDQELLGLVNKFYKEDFDYLDYPQTKTIKELHEIYS